MSKRMSAADRWGKRRAQCLLRVKNRPLPTTIEEWGWDMAEAYEIGRSAGLRSAKRKATRKRTKP